MSIAPDGSVDYDGRNLDHGFIVDNKVFVVDEGGVDSFFNNTGIVGIVVSNNINFVDFNPKLK